MRAPSRVQGVPVTVVRVAVWALNTVLFVLCCWLTAGLINAGIGEMLATPPPPPPPRAATAAPPSREWSDRQAILDRNLFQVSTLLPETPEPEQTEVPEEELEATRLPLRLLGTVASDTPESAWAAIEDQQNRKQIVVRVNDRVLDKAQVLRIDRRRIVLQNGAKREELALDEDETAGV
jgi:hypothetical protein